jgi:acetylornithine deacetylase/succinyl-diaminopimelate desuccinylase-like protein
MLIAAKQLLYEGITPKTDVLLVFAADEEAGSRYGMDYIMDCGPPFSDTAQAYVPDAGDNGKSVEIAEKGMVEFKFMYTGKNARFSAVTFEKTLYDLLHTTFLDKCEGFTPETSTFEPTADETTINSAPNVIPGEYTSVFTVKSIPESIDLKEWVQHRAASFANRENEGLPLDSGRTLRIVVAIDQNELVLTYKGKECHASRPDLGRNARLASLHFESVLLDELEQNSIVPATKNTYWSTWDCRIVPDHDGAAQKVRDAVKDVAQTKTDVIDFKELACGEPQATLEDAPISRAVHHAYTQLGTDPKYTKIGGRTFAAILRKGGIQAVAGGTVDGDLCHQIDEYVVIKDAVKEVDVIMYLIENWGSYV